MGFGATASYRDTLNFIGPFVGGELSAPVSPGDMRIEVVTRSRIVGHFFPTGTIDAQEAWLEVKVTDALGNPIFWSGFVDETGRVDPSAHFFKSVTIDADADLIDKRNAFEMRSVVYVNLVPPGAADVAHYRVSVPDDAVGPFAVVSRLNYRKFTDAYTRFSYSAVVDGDPHSVSGPMKAIPEVPVVVMATDSVLLDVSGTAQVDNSAATQRTARPAGALWERWTDYGIGLLAEGDLRGAERAFGRASKADPRNPDSWVNLARVFINDDRLEAAAEALGRALELRPGFAKALFFRAMYFRSRGDYARAVADLDEVLTEFPRDRVALNQRARLLFLLENYAGATSGFTSVLAIDSEDLMAHYNLMLVYRAQGDSASAKEHEARYRRYRDDETTQELARIYRQRHPHVNNEAQPIHEHTSFYPPAQK